VIPCLGDYIIRGAMTNEQKKALARVMRRFAELCADRPALIALLDSYAEQKVLVPKDWQKRHLAPIQQSDDYRKVLAEFEPLILELEGGIGDEEMIALFEKISHGKLPN
jgi:hypothetical protein